MRYAIVTIVMALALQAVQARAEFFYAGTQSGHRVDEISSNGVVSVFANLPAKAVYTSGVAFDASGNLFTSDPNKNTIYEITPAGAVSVFKTVPSGTFPGSMAFDSYGYLYLANVSTRQVNKIAPDGTLSLFATLPVGSSVSGLAFDASGNLYAAGGDAINRISQAGTVSLFATLPTNSGGSGLAFDRSGTLFVADLSTDMISRVSPSGMVSTFANLPANEHAIGLAFDNGGNLYEAGLLGTIHKITSDGTVSLFANDPMEEFLSLAATDDSGHPVRLPPSTLFGDYNLNGVVDADDYVVWRNGLGTVYAQGDFDVWRNHFGQTPGSGSAVNSVSVPEPTSATLLLLGVLGCGWRGRRPPYTISCSAPTLPRYFGRSLLGCVLGDMG